MKPAPVYSNVCKAIPDMTDAIDQKFITQARAMKKTVGTQ